MNAAKIAVRVIALALVSGLCGPVVVAAARDQGVLEVQIKDHREAIDDFARFDLVIDRISISPKPGLMFWQTGWTDLTPSMRKIDLTQYIGKKTAQVFRGALDAGSFDALEVRIQSIEAVLKKNSSKIGAKNNLRPIKLSFEIPARGKTVLVLDLTVTDFSDHPPRGYELDVRGYEIYTNGKLVEKIPPG